MRPIVLKRPRRSIGSSRVCGKGSLVEPMGRRTAVEARIANQVRAVISDSSQGLVCAAGHCEGDAGSGGNDWRQLPAAQQELAHIGSVRGAADDGRSHEVVTQVRAAVAVIEIRVSGILKL